MENNGHTIARMRPDHILAWSEDRLEVGGDNPRPGLFLWVPEGLTAAIGLAQNPDRELRLAAMVRDGVTLIRRQSGGGAVLLCPGVLCWEAWAPLDAVARNDEGGDSGIRPTYAFLSRPAIMGLRRLGLEVFRDGVSDLSTPGSDGGERRKIAGTAQLRRKHMALVHGSILVHPDLSLLERYLKTPEDQPKYRRRRTHRDFCVSAAEMLGKTANPADLALRLAGEIAAAAREMDWEVFPPEAAPDDPGAPFRSKYRSDEWNYLGLREPPRGGK